MALSAPSLRSHEQDVEFSYHPMAVAKAYQGGLAVLDSAGFVKPGVAATSLTAVGIFDFTAEIVDGYMDNTGGSAGDLFARVRRGIFCFKNSASDPVVQADDGLFCYIDDDETVCHTGTGKSVAGIVRRIDSAGVWVWIGASFGSALTTEIAARELITTDLAKTTTPGGASLVGIFDTAGKFAADNVEAALAEAIDGKRLATVADDATQCGAMVVHTIAVPATASSTKSITLAATYGKIRILDVHFIKAGTTGATTDAVKLTDGTHDITDSLALNAKEAGAVVRATSINPTYATLAAGATLVANYTKDAVGTAEGTLVITGVRSA